MLNNLRIPLALSLTVLVSFFLCASGLETKIPSEEIQGSLFPDKGLLPSLIPLINDARQSDKEYTDSLRKYKEMEIGGRYYMNLPHDYWEKIEEEKEIILKNKHLFISTNKFKWMGNYLIGSNYPDEQGIIHTLSRLKLKPLDLNLHNFAYGGAYIYPLAATLKLAAMLKLINLNPDRKYNMSNPGNTQKIFIYGKLFGILAYMLSIIIIYFICRIMYKNNFIAVLSAIFLAFNPGLIVTSHSLKPWIYSIFWVLLCLYFASKLNLTAKDNKKLYIFAGIAAGLATGSVFPAGYIFLAVVLFHLYVNKMQNFKLVIYSFSALLLTYIISNPYHLIGFREFIYVYRYTNETWFSQVRYSDLLNHLVNFIDISYAFGILFAISVLCGIIILLVKRKKEDIVLLLCIIAYYIVNYKIISGNYPITLHTRYVHAVPLIPLLIIAGARFLQWLYEFQNKRIWVVLFIIFAIIDSLAHSLFYASKFKTMPELEAAKWINKNIPSYSTIGTWIAIDGYRPGYPPYNYLNYRFMNDTDKNLPKIIERKPEYCIVISIPYLKDPFYNNIKLLNSYREIKSFKGPESLLSNFYSNKLIYFWVEEIKIFKHM